ncbi:MAG: hypothetical protein ACXITR_00420 [Cyanobacterium sp.]
MTQPTSLTWNFKGTTCTMGLIHAPMATINYSGGGNGCGASGGENPVTLNNVFGVTGSPFGGSTATPNHFGSMWVNSLTPNNSNAMALYENKTLSLILAKEYGSTYFLGDTKNQLFDVDMGDRILSLTRLPVVDTP